MNAYKKYKKLLGCAYFLMAIFGFTTLAQANGAACYGDFDQDLDVDGSDLAQFSAHFGRTDCDTDVLSVVGEWEHSGGRNARSFLNRHYQFDVVDESEVTISLRSNVRYTIYLIDPIDIVMASITDRPLVMTLTPGTYTVVAATFSSGEKSSFELSVSGLVNSGLLEVDSTSTEVTGNWARSGGRSIKSYRNRHYSLEIPTDSYLNILSESDIRENLYLIDSLGNTHALGENSIFAQVEAGNYKIVAATYSAGETSNFKMTIAGQYENLQAIPSNTISKAGSWESSGGQDPQSPDNRHYDISVTEASMVDIMLVSNTSNYIYLLKESGLLVAQVSGNRLTANVEPGNYRVVAATHFAGQSSAFELEIVGQVTE